MKVDVCIIVKNEEDTIGKLIKQFLMFANEIHITDTGSTDSTVQIIENACRMHSNVYMHCYEWCNDFSKARNYSLTCYECNADYQFWCDGDDELNEKLIGTLQEFTRSNDKEADIYFMKYKYFDNDKNPHNRTSLLKTGAGLEWHDPIHEYIGYTVNHKVDYDYFNNGSLIIHKRKPGTVHTDRNLQIFQQMERDHYKMTARNRFYYGRELSYVGLHECAISQLHRCIDMEEDNNLDKFNACKLLFKLKDEQAPEYFFKMISQGRCRKDLLYYMAKYLYDTGKKQISKAFYLGCVEYEKPRPSWTFGYDPSCVINSLLQLGVIYWNEGDMQKARECNERIIKIDPKNGIALNNICLIDNKINKGIV